MSELKLYNTRPAAWIEVTGGDTGSFLQSQFSNDLTPHEENKVVYGLWLDRQGHVHGDSFVLQHSPQHFTLLSYFTPASSLISKLDAFIIADDVVLNDQTASRSMLSLWGDGLAALFDTIPEKCKFVVSDEAITLNGLRSREPNLDIVAPSAAIKELAYKLAKEAQLSIATEADAETERIQSIIPAVPADIGPTDFPQEGGLENNAISFTKGCFLGQEVVARMFHKDRAARKLVKVEYTEDIVDQTDKIFSKGREAGQIRTRVSCRGKRLALALIKSKALEDSSYLHLEGHTESIINIIS